MKKTISVIVCLLVALVSMAIATDNVEVVVDVDSGSIDVTTRGIDHSTFHPGSIGQEGVLSSDGSFSGSVLASEGNYGSLNTRLNLKSKTIGADIRYSESQDFNILSANRNSNVIGGFYSRAYADNDQAELNIKSVGSMYVWSEATNPYSRPNLKGQIIEKEAWTTKNGVLKSDLYLGVATTGVASLSNSNIWGWGNYESGKSTTNYAGGTRSLTVTGAGTITQQAIGVNNVLFNGMTMGGDSVVTLSGSFTDGLTGTYNMEGE